MPIKITLSRYYQLTNIIFSPIASARRDTPSVNPGKVELSPSMSVTSRYLKRLP